MYEQEKGGQKFIKINPQLLSAFLALILAIIEFNKLARENVIINVTEYWALAKAFIQQNFETSPYLKIMHATKDCGKCHFRARNRKESNSNQNDVIVGIITNIDYNLIVFMRTLRTTKSKCSVVLITDDSAYKKMENITKEYMEFCGCQIINAGKIMINPYTYREVNWRFYMLYIFLIRNKRFIDRVITLDVFDSAFQGDPFNTQVNRTHINAVDEGIPYKLCNINSNWFRDIAGSMSDEESEIFFPCAGYLGASVNMMISFLDLYFQKYKWGGNYNDQGLVGYLVVRSPFRKLRSEVRQTEFVYHNARFHFNGGYTKIGDVRTIRNNDAYASVIHHYYTSKSFKSSLEEACPRPAVERYINPK